jgi:hypothetical protein
MIALQEHNYREHQPDQTHPSRQTPSQPNYQWPRLNRLCWFWGSIGWFLKKIPCSCHKRRTNFTVILGLDILWSKSVCPSLWSLPSTLSEWQTSICQDAFSGIFYSLGSFCEISSVNINSDCRFDWPDCYRETWNQRRRGCVDTIVRRPAILARTESVCDFTAELCIIYLANPPWLAATVSKPTFNDVANSRFWHCCTSVPLP